MSYPLTLEMVDVRKGYYLEPSPHLHIEILAVREQVYLDHEQRIEVLEFLLELEGLPSLDKVRKMAWIKDVDRRMAEQAKARRERYRKRYARGGS